MLKNVTNIVELAVKAEKSNFKRLLWLFYFADISEIVKMDCSFVKL